MSPHRERREQRWSLTPLPIGLVAKFFAQLFTALLAQVLSTLLPRAFDTVAIEGGSMAPTYARGDWLLVRNIKPSSRPRVEVGQVVLVERREEPGPLLIKRLVDIRADSPNRHYPTYWVEGDNPELSQDSRKWGALDGEEIVGKVLFRFKKADR